MSLSVYQKREEYRKGLWDSLPVGVGYFAVSFGFGALAVSRGMAWWQATLISLTNLTSAGQYAGLTVILALGGYLELVLTQLIINSRYLLMSLALTQRLDGTFTRPVKALCAFFNTDEIFALAMQRPGLGWTLGTLCGAAAGSVLPAFVRDCLGLALYAMFVAIVFPQAKESAPVRWVVLAAVVISCLFQWVPGLDRVSPGLAIVIATVAAALLGALLFPVGEEEKA